MEPKDFQNEYIAGLIYKRVGNGVIFINTITKVSEYIGKYCTFINAEKMYNASSRNSFETINLQVVTAMPDSIDETCIIKTKNNKRLANLKIKRAAKNFWRTKCHKHYRDTIANFMYNLFNFPMELCEMITQFL